MGGESNGKEIFTVQGEYSANMIREAILGEKADVKAPAQVPGRPPILCPGCPHRSVYHVLNKLKIHAAGDIGCYTLGELHHLVLWTQQSVWEQVFQVFMEWKRQKERLYQELGSCDRGFYIFTYRCEFAYEYDV